MKLSIRYFGVITEIAGKELEDLELGKNSVEGLKSLLNSKYPALALIQYKVSVNRKITECGIIGLKDEVVLMPPFSGG